MIRASILGIVLASSLFACSESAPSDQDPAATQAVVESESNEVSGEPVVGGPRNGGCADARAELVYAISQYEGGAPPPPGMIVGRQTLTYKGDLVGQTLRREGGVVDDFFGGEAEVDHHWDITLRFVDGTKHVIESTGAGTMSGSVTYTQKVEGRFVLGLGPTIEHNSFQALVICNDHWNHGMP